MKNEEFGNVPTEKIINFFKKHKIITIPVKKGEKRCLINEWPNRQLGDINGFEENSNVGVLMGEKSELTCFDFDILKPGDHEKNFVSGVEWLEKQEKIHGKIDTFRVNTPSGGVHLYFKYCLGIITDTNVISQKITDSNGVEKNFEVKIDTRNNGGYVVSPWSYNKEHIKYYTIANTTQDINQVIPQFINCPLWLIASICPKLTKEKNERKSKMISELNSSDLSKVEEIITEFEKKYPEVKKGFSRESLKENFIFLQRKASSLCPVHNRVHDHQNAKIFLNESEDGNTIYCQFFCFQGGDGEQTVRMGNLTKEYQKQKIELPLETENLNINAEPSTFISESNLLNQKENISTDSISEINILGNLPTIVQDIKLLPVPLIKIETVSQNNSNISSPTTDEKEEKENDEKCHEIMLKELKKVWPEFFSIYNFSNKKDNFFNYHRISTGEQLCKCCESRHIIGGGSLFRKINRGKKTFTGIFRCSLLKKSDPKKYIIGTFDIPGLYIEKQKVGSSTYAFLEKYPKIFITALNAVYSDESMADLLSSEMKTITKSFSEKLYIYNESSALWEKTELESLKVHKLNKIFYSIYDGVNTIITNTIKTTKDQSEKSFFESKIYYINAVSYTHLTLPTSDLV